MQLQLQLHLCMRLRAKTPRTNSSQHSEENQKLQHLSKTSIPNSNCNNSVSNYAIRNGNGNALRKDNSNKASNYASRYKNQSRQETMDRNHNCTNRNDGMTLGRASRI
mmetsp:Transcript_16927/g.46483  ORF Transcript_16927/g.46483 Transcript_16927/m.46483 type:complete len:108 (-) Transcript_16927:1956-2279(-)